MNLPQPEFQSINPDPLEAKIWLALNRQKNESPEFDALKADELELYNHLTKKLCVLASMVGYTVTESEP